MISDTENMSRAHTHTHECTTASQSTNVVLRHISAILCKMSDYLQLPRNL
jgi:hypothetical protein